ncbi:Hypothetical predicted protein [Mytilus galloprovincialis]|uniref:Uncharacterized protein n=1 Tax=Mytilus galloprovincialis TaxID=29158 RepID=A0A8B6H0K3_MYTGA|nr:Hypothetical predicted protein [Mytilus galloprovincialis]
MDQIMLTCTGKTISDQEKIEGMFTPVKSGYTPNGKKQIVHLGFKGSSRQTTLKGSSKLACRAIVLKQYKTAINHLLQIEDLKKDIFQITKKKDEPGAATNMSSKGECVKYKESSV